MGDIFIRNVDDSIISKLDYLAKSKGMSRTKYLKMYLESLVVLDDLKELDSKYSVLVGNTALVMEQVIDYLKRNEALLQDLREKKEDSNHVK